MRVLIVDDEEPARRRLRRLLQDAGGLEIAGEAANGMEALERIAALKPDLVFLDVQMPLLGGFEMLEELGSRAPAVVFVTSYDRYALEAFEASAVDYLLKPVAPERLERALAKARRYLETGTQEDTFARLGAALRRAWLQRIVGRRGPKLLVAAIEDVQAFVAEDELVFAVLREGRLLVNFTLRDLEARLDPERFARVHKQAIVNLSHLVELTPVLKGGAVARLASGVTVEISRRYAPSLRERLGW